MIFTIAEIGINHNGDIDIAKKLIRMANLCGCDAVKFQKREIDLVYDSKFLDEPRNSPWGDTQRAQKEGIELNCGEYLQLRKLCEDLKVDFGASCWDTESQYFINSIEPDFQKVASPMLTNKSLLRIIAEKGIYTYISTGMSTEEEIQEAIDIFEENECKFELMHCVSVYPMDPELANLNRIISLRNKFGCDVGYSGHEVGVGVSVAACAMGITSIERHITLDRAMYGSDQAASLEIEGLRKLVKYSKEVFVARGSGKFELSEEELKIRNKLRN